MDQIFSIIQSIFNIYDWVNHFLVLLAIYVLLFCVYCNYILRLDLSNTNLNLPIKYLFKRGSSVHLKLAISAMLALLSLWLIYGVTLYFIDHG